MLSCSFQVEGGMLTLDCTGNKQCQSLICESQKMTEDPSALAFWTTKSNRPRKVTKWTAGAHYLGIWKLTFLSKTEFKIKATTTKTFSLTEKEGKYISSISCRITSQYTFLCSWLCISQQPKYSCNWNPLFWIHWSKPKVGAYKGSRCPREKTWN